MGDKTNATIIIAAVIIFLLLIAHASNLDLTGLNGAISGGKASITMPYSSWNGIHHVLRVSVAPNGTYDQNASAYDFFPVPFLYPAFITIKNTLVCTRPPPWYYALTFVNNATNIFYVYWNSNASVQVSHGNDVHTQPYLPLTTTCYVIYGGGKVEFWTDQTVATHIFMNASDLPLNRLIMLGASGFTSGDVTVSYDLG